MRPKKTLETQNVIPTCVRLEEELLAERDVRLERGGQAQDERLPRDRVLRRHVEGRFARRGGGVETGARRDAGPRGLRSCGAQMKEC